MGNNVFLTILRAVSLLPVVHGASPNIVFILADDMVSVSFIIYYISLLTDLSEIFVWYNLCLKEYYYCLAHSFSII